MDRPLVNLGYKSQPRILQSDKGDVMKTFTCGHCGGRHQDLEQVKTCSQVANNTVGNTKDRIVTATCVRWVSQPDGPSTKMVHNWTAPLSEVAGQRCCPDHR